MRRTSLNTCLPAMQDANFDCSSTGFALQAMDSSHVSLIHMQVWPPHFQLTSSYHGRWSTCTLLIGCSMTSGMASSYDANAARVEASSSLYSKRRHARQPCLMQCIGCCLQLYHSSEHLMLQVQCRIAGELPRSGSIVILHKHRGLSMCMCVAAAALRRL